MDESNGGRAFPNDGEWANGHPEGGMSLRDYFAAKAMAAFVSTAAAPCLNGLDGYEAHTAAASYRMADAMLKAREAQP